MNLIVRSRPLGPEGAGCMAKVKLLDPGSRNLCSEARSLTHPESLVSLNRRVFSMTLQGMHRSLEGGASP